LGFNGEGNLGGASVDQLKNHRRNSKGAGKGGEKYLKTKKRGPYRGGRKPFKRKTLRTGL